MLVGFRLAVAIVVLPVYLYFAEMFYRFIRDQIPIINAMGKME